MNIEEFCNNPDQPQMPNPACEQRMLGIEQQLRHANAKLDKVMSLLKGDDSGNPGLVGRVNILELKVSTAEKAGGGLVKMILTPIIAAVVGAAAGWVVSKQ